MLVIIRYLYICLEFKVQRSMAMTLELLAQQDKEFHIRLD